MVPEGPYRSQWTTGDWFLVSTVQADAICFSVVKNGRQPHEGTLFPKTRAARAFLKDNGFKLPLGCRPAA